MMRNPIREEIEPNTRNKILTVGNTGVQLHNADKLVAARVVSLCYLARFTVHPALGWNSGI